MDKRILTPFRICHLALVLLTISANGNVSHMKDIVQSGLIHSCIGLKPTQMEICNDIELEDDFIANDVDCNIEDCKRGCCSTIDLCFKENFFTYNRVDCVSNKLKENYGTCCNVKAKKYNKTKVLYLSGGLGIVVASIGVYVLSSMRSKSIETYDSSEFGDEDHLSNLDDGSPHLDVNNLVATDGNDVFWED